MNFLHWWPFAAKNLLLLDLNSNGILAYYAPDTGDLSQLNFRNLHLLERKRPTVAASNFSIQNPAFRKNLLNSLSTYEAEITALAQQLRRQGINAYQLYLLIADGHSSQEQQALQQSLSILSWRPARVIARPYFYWYYLQQSKNFSQDKLLLLLFNDCVELSFFQGEQLLLSQTLNLANFWPELKDFWQSLSLRLERSDRPVAADCCYLFDLLQSGAIKTQDLSQLLKLEAIRITSLTSLQGS